MKTGNFSSSISLKRTARNNQAPLFAKIVGSAEADRLTENGIGVEDLDADPLSLNQVSSRKNGSKSAQKGMSANLIRIFSLLFY